MLSAGVGPLDKRHFDILCSSVSAVVWELYAGLPGSLLAELSALSDSTRILDVKPQTPAFALSCSSSPSEHQRTTHGLTLCFQAPAQRLGSEGKGSCPGLMDLSSEEPAEAVKHAEDSEGQYRDSLKLDSLQGCLMEDAGLANDCGGVAMESVMQCSLTSAETQWPKEKEHWPIHQGREPVSTSACTELEDLLQGLDSEGNGVDVRCTPETLSNPMKEAAGMEADGPGLFSRAGQRSAQGSPGILPEGRQSASTGTARGEVSGANALAAREPRSVVDGTSGKGQQRGEEEGHVLAARAILSATQRQLLNSEAGEENFCHPGGGVNAFPSSCSPHLQNKMNLYDNNKSSIPVLENNLMPGSLHQSALGFETLGLHYQSCVESGHLMWEENVDICEEVCEMEEETPADEGGNWSHTNCEHIAPVEEQASGATTDLEAPLNAEELPADSNNQRELDFYREHSYSCICWGTVDFQNRDSERFSWKEQADSPLEIGHFEDPVGHLALAEKTHSESSISSLLSTHDRLSGQLSKESLRTRFSGVEPTSSDCLPQGTKRSDVRLSGMGSSSGLRTEIFTHVSATEQHSAHSSSLAGINLAASQGGTITVHLCDGLPSTQQESPSVEEFPGSRAEQGHGLLIQSRALLSPVSQNGSRVQSTAHSPHGPTLGTHGTLSGAVCLDGDDYDGVEGRPEMSTEGLTIASACEKEIPPKPGGEMWRSRLSSRWEGAEGALGRCTSAKSEDTQDVDTHTVPPITDLERKPVQYSPFAHADGSKRAEGINDVADQGNDRPSADRGLDESSHAVESGRLRKNCGRRHRPLSSPLPDHPILTSERSVVMKLGRSPGPARETISQGKVQLRTNRKVRSHGCILFNQKKESSERDALKCQETHWVVPAEPKVNCAAIVSRFSAGAPEWARCVASFSSPAPLRERDFQEVIQQRTQNPFRKEAFELISKQLSQEPFGLKNVPLCCPKLASEVLRLNWLLTGLGSHIAAADDFCPATKTAAWGLSGVWGKNIFLPLNGNVAFIACQAFLWPGLTTCAAAAGSQKNLGRAEVSALSWTHIGVQLAQDLGVSFSPGAALPASSSPNLLCFPPAKEHPIITVSFERIASYHVNSLTGNSSASWAVQGSTNVEPLLEGQKIALYPGGGQLRFELTGEIVSVMFSNLYPSEEIKQFMGEEKRKDLVRAEKMELLVPFVYDNKNPSGFFWEDLKFPFPGEGTTFPFKVQVQIWPSFLCVSEHLISGFVWRNVEDAKQPPFAHQHSKKVSCALQMEFPTLSSLGDVCCRLCWKSTGSNMPEALPSPLAGKGRGFQSEIKSRQDPEGAPWKGCLFTLGNEARSPGTGNFQVLTQKGAQEASQVSSRQGVWWRRKARGLLHRQCRPLEQHLSNSLREIGVKLEDRPPQTLALISLVKDEDANPCGATRAKRPRIAMDNFGLEHTVAQSSSPHFRSHSCQSVRWQGTAAVCGLPDPLGFTCVRSQGQKRRGFILRRKQPGTACIKMPVCGQPKAAKRRWLTEQLAFIMNPPEVIPQGECTFTQFVFFAQKSGAPGKEGTMERYPEPKPDGSQSRLLVAHRSLSPTKDPACMQWLSTLASKLPALQSICGKAKQPGRLYQAQRKKHLVSSSWTKMKFSSQWTNRSSSSCFRIFSSQSPALCSVKPTCVLEPGSQAPLASGVPAIHPPFRLQVSTGTASSLFDTMVSSGAPRRAPLGERGALSASRWGTFSFLLSQSSLGSAPLKRDAWILTGSPIKSALLRAAKDEGNGAIARSSPGRGLLTALALFSPGCYRVWTRKRSLANRIPAVRKVTVLQFTRGLKGLKCSSSLSADLFSSLPRPLGRVLSIWSQHGPPTCPSELSPLHPKGCKWQPIATASASLGFGNSSTMVPQMLEQLVEAAKATNEATREPSLAASLPTSSLIPEAAPPPLGFLGPEFQIHPLDELGGPAAALPQSGNRLGKVESEKRLKKVSQIRIRKTVPKPDPNLTPMGLPRPKRLKKTEFSLEEIYTNKNYKSPPSSRSLETIFEEPKEKNGSLISVSQQKRKRILEFQDFTVPRKRKARSRVKVMGSSTRAQKAALGGQELDVLLVQKLTDLEAFFAKEEEQEKASSS